jgi:hypothetical protein
MRLQQHGKLRQEFIGALQPTSFSMAANLSEPYACQETCATHDRLLQLLIEHLQQTPASAVRWSGLVDGGDRFGGNLLVVAIQAGTISCTDGSPSTRRGRAVSSAVVPSARRAPVFGCDRSTGPWHRRPTRHVAGLGVGIEQVHDRWPTSAEVS